MPQQVFDFGAKAGIATFSLARIKRVACARLARMTALFLDIFVTSTSALRKDAMNEAKKAGKSLYMVDLGAYISDHLPRPEKNIHSIFLDLVNKQSCTNIYKQ